MNEEWELIEKLKSNKPVLLCDYDCEVSPDLVMLLAFDPSPCLIMMGALKEHYLPSDFSPERVTEEEFYELKTQCLDDSPFHTRPKGRIPQEVVKIRLDTNNAKEYFSVLSPSPRESLLIFLRAVKARLERHK